MEGVPNKMESDMDRFGAQGATEYDARISTLVPGYTVLHEVSAAVLHARLPEYARVLVVGAGTGAEILALAQKRPDWRFTALDTSADMLAMASQKCAAKGIHQVDFFHGLVADLPMSEPYDAVLCLLVMHFISGVREKQAFLCSIARHTKMGAPLLLCDLMQGDDTERAAMAEYAVAHGLPEQFTAALKQRLSHEFFVLTELEWVDLATQSGFRQPLPYFRALGFAAYICLRT